MSRSHQTARLVAGKHSGPDNGVCVMELASMLAGEPFSDRPRTASRTLAALLRGYNDGLDDVRRQTLKPYAAASVGSAGGWRLERRRRRAVRAAFDHLRVNPPALDSVIWALEVTDLGHIARRFGVQVAATGDEQMHARMLDLFDALLAMGRRGPACQAPDRMPAPATQSLDPDDARVVGRP